MNNSENHRQEYFTKSLFDHKKSKTIDSPKSSSSLKIQILEGPLHPNLTHLRISETWRI